MLQEPTKDFNFEGIKLGPPNGLQGGSYFTKILNNNDPLYLQIPKCLTKQGVVVTEKKKYCDLMFSRDATDVISWFENIERHVQGLLYEKKNIWFHEDLEESDIENAFTSPIRSYRSGQYYLVRCTVPKVISPETISCYNENEEPMSLDVINDHEIEIIPLVEIQGVRFSSKNFQIEIGLRQVMAIKKKEIFKNCLIKIGKSEHVQSSACEVTEEVENYAPDNAAPVEDAAPGEDEAPVEDAAPGEDEAPIEDTAPVEDATSGELVAPAQDAAPVEDAILAENVAIPAEDVASADVTLAEEVPEKSNVINETISTELPPELQEVSIDTIEESDPLVLKNPTDVYYEMWRSARQKARMARKEALAAYLEAKQIKENYMLDGIDSESDEDIEFEQVLA